MYKPLFVTIFILTAVSPVFAIMAVKDTMPVQVEALKSRLKRGVLVGFLMLFRRNTEGASRPFFKFINHRLHIMCVKTRYISD